MWLAEGPLSFMCPVFVQSRAAEVHVFHALHGAWAEPVGLGGVGWGWGEGHTDAFPLPGCWLTGF